MNMNLIKNLILFSCSAGLILAGFQNCGGSDFGEPNISSEGTVPASLELSGFDPNGSPTVLRTIDELFFPKAYAAVMNAHGCLKSIGFLRYDPRWARQRNNGNYSIDWDAISEIPSHETHARINFDYEVELNPDGTPLGNLNLPQGHFIRTDINFSRFPCRLGYGFQVTNDNGTFSSRILENGNGMYRTSFFIKSEFVVDSDSTRMLIHTQPIIDHLNEVSSDREVWGSHAIDGLIEIFSDEATDDI